MRGEAEPTLATLERIYRAHFRAFVRTATAYLGDPEAARDAVQEAMASAIRNRRAYRGDGTVEAWVWRIVVNAIRTEYRERTKSLWFADGADEEPGSCSPDDESSVALVRAAVRRLPERQRLVLFLRFYADMDYAAIATVAEISEGTVGAALNVARERLRGLFEEVRA
jgi:RNA polymerase sigma factor (sigma-70 family)